MPKRRKLSWPQRRYLLNMLAGAPTNRHCETQSDYGGLQATAFWAARAGYTTFGTAGPGGKPIRLTPAGRTPALAVKAEEDAARGASRPAGRGGRRRG